jgi:hypothetical protein
MYMSDILGQRPNRIGRDDIWAVTVVARYALRLARRYVLRPGTERFLDFGEVKARSFHCEIRYLPFDQTSASHPVETADDAVVAFSTAPGQLRLQFWRLPSEDEVASASFEGPQSDLNPRADPPTSSGEPSLSICLCNRGAAEPKDVTTQRRFRRFVRRLLPRARGVDLELLSSRSIYVGDKTTVEDLKAQLALTLIRGQMLAQDSSVSRWFAEEYLFRFLPGRVKTDPETARTVCESAFEGIWRNAGDNERAQAWRPYIRAWVSKTEQSRRHAGTRTLDQYAADRDADEEGDPDEAAGAISSERKRQRNAYYTVPAIRDGEPMTVEEAAGRLRVSTRQIYRLIEQGILRRTPNDRNRLEAADISACILKYSERQAARSSRLVAIGELMHQAKKASKKLGSEGARKAEQRQRKRGGREHNL